MRALVPEVAGPEPQLGIGVIVPYDMALDRELWRWAPDDVSLYLTRTPYSPLPVTIEMAEHVSDTEQVRAGVRDLQTAAPAVYAYACTSGSFVRGRDAERVLVDAMRLEGAPAAVTTSGAILEALAAVDARRVAVATPYDPQVTERLERFLDEAGIAVSGSAHLGLSEDIWKVPYSRTAQMIVEADEDTADAVIVSCTNLPTFDLIAPLEQQLGKPVITANQATMWAALSALGQSLVGPGQRLTAAA